MAEAANAGVDSIDGEPLCLGNTAVLPDEKQKRVEHLRRMLESRCNRHKAGESGNSYAVFKELKLAEAAAQLVPTPGDEEQMKVEYLEAVHAMRCGPYIDGEDGKNYAVEAEATRYYVQPAEYKIEEANAAATCFECTVQPSEDCTCSKPSRSKVHKRNYDVAEYRDNDVLEAITSGGEKLSISRLAATFFNFPCKNDQAVKTFKILKPDGFLIAERYIQQATLDAHYDMWLINRISLQDFLFLYAHHDTLAVNTHLPCKYLDMKDGYTCYRLYEISSIARKGVLSFELWWHNRVDFDFTKDLTNLILALKEAHKARFEVHYIQDE